MAKEDFISGSIFQFNVPKNIGYGYCKVLDFRHLRKIDGILAKVFDLIVESPLDDINDLRKIEWLFGARRLYDLPNSRGKGAWKFKGVEISKDDNEIPDFKYSPKLSPTTEDESLIQNWYVSRNLKELNYDEVYSYSQVRHLEDTVIDSTISIEIRTAMEYYRKHQMDLEKDFDLEDMANWNNYRRMTNIPIYSSIPKEIRGKAIGNL